VLQIEHLISDGQNLILRKNMRKGFGPFGTDNNVVGPVVAENLIEKEFKRIARDINITVANPGFNTVMKILFELVGCELRSRLAGMLFKKLYMTEIMILRLWRIASKFHFEEHLLKMSGKSLGFLRHKNHPFKFNRIKLKR